MLFDAYSSFVAINVKSVLTIHILLFVLTVILMGCYVFFMVLPFVKATTFETRRIAELMSQLPAEVGGWVGGRARHAQQQLCMHLGDACQ
jgi:membrane-bound ClpP family serine protease